MKAQKERKLYFSPVTDVFTVNPESIICESPLEGVGEGGEHGWDTMMPDIQGGLDGLL